MYILSLVLFLVALGYDLFSIRSMMVEKAYLLHHDAWEKEVGIFGLTGSLLMFTAGFILQHQPDFTMLFGCDSLGASYIMYMLAVIGFGMSGLAWFSITRLAFYVDNRRWPTESELINR